MKLRKMASWLAMAVCLCSLPALPAFAQQGSRSQTAPSPANPSPPPAGFSLALTLGPGWASNPPELPGRQKGDGYFGFEAVLAHRWSLWEGAALTVSGSGYSELYARDADAGLNRLGASASLSQRWMGMILTSGVSARTSANQQLTAHDSASQEISLGLARPFTLAPDLTLTLSSGLARRFYQDGTEDQFRARFGATLARKWNLWTFRIGSGFGWALEDKTPILPRINDRTLSATASASYEWAGDREVSAKFTWSRTYSSYPVNRYQMFGFTPQVSATLRF